MLLRNKLFAIMCFASLVLTPAAFAQADDTAPPVDAQTIGDLNPDIQLIPGPFAVPAGMKGRVKFWVDIFSKYGKDSAVIHHRDYPQVIFEVLDFRREAQHFPAVVLDRFKEKVKRARVSAITDAFKWFGRGGAPRTDFEIKLVGKMKLVPGGIEKYTDAVKDDLIRAQTGIREKFGDSLTRSGRYLPIMERIFQEYDLPLELTRLPFVESSFDYTAYSSVGAAGIWQFMPRTARLYMKVNPAVDERRDPISSTMAAAKYLSGAYDTLGTWPLALTSYNHGVAGVGKAVRKMGTKDISALVESQGDRVFGFASNNFYAEFLAALDVQRNHKKYFPGIPIEQPLRFDQIRLTIPHTIQFIGLRLGISLEDLKPLNYAISKAAWEGRLKIPVGYTLKVPVGFGMYASRLGAGEPEEFVQNVETSSSSVYGGVTYTVRKGDTLSSIAKRFRTTAAEIQELNGMSGASLRVGQKLKIQQPQEIKRTVQTKKAEPTQTPIKQSTGGQSYTVKSGDSLWSISRKFALSVEKLKRANNLRRSAVKPGDKLIVP